MTEAPTDRTMSISQATPADAAVVLRLFDDAIAWFVRIGNEGQWGREPFSAQRQVDRVTGWCGEPGAWLAEHPDAGVCGALVLGEATDYVPATTEPELYVKVLIGSRDRRAKGAGRRLLAFADDHLKLQPVVRLLDDLPWGVEVAFGDPGLALLPEHVGRVPGDADRLKRRHLRLPGEVSMGVEVADVVGQDRRHI
jgi:hypothetical protein